MRRLSRNRILKRKGWGRYLKLGRSVMKGTRRRVKRGSYRR